MPIQKHHITTSCRFSVVVTHERDSNTVWECNLEFFLTIILLKCPSPQFLTTDSEVYIHTSVDRSSQINMMENYFNMKCSNWFIVFTLLHGFWSRLTTPLLSPLFVWMFFQSQKYNLYTKYYVIWTGILMRTKQAQWSVNINETCLR